MQTKVGILMILILLILITLSIIIFIPKLLYFQSETHTAHINVEHLRKAGKNVTLNEGFGQLLEVKK